MIKSSLIARETIARETMKFSFEKPEGFAFKAGQTMDLSLVNPVETDDEGNERTFSITSSPGGETLEIATRMRDTAFKRNLKNIPLGLEVGIDGPHGSFFLHENAARPAAFLAGGIGVTPFHSMIKDAAERKLEHKIYLFYSNRKPADAAFLDELKNLEKSNPNFKLIPTMTEAEPADNWDGETGYIDGGMLKKYLPSDSSPVYYIAGPDAMVGAMRKMLADAQISPDDVRFEEFAGY